jgi:isopenicillin-N N-acyltransferase-like protein
MRAFFARHPKKLGALALTAVAPFALHFAIVASARETPPEVSVPEHALERKGAVTRFGDAYVRRRGSLLEVGLRGSPETIGYSHARLLYDEMVENEGILLDRFDAEVPSAILRRLLLDLAQARYRNLDVGMSRERVREIAAGALGFQPDPFARFFPTYQRFLYLNALYDIALSFEGSPLIGCTTFTFSGASVARESGSGQGAILARAFDFEVDDVFDRQKAVFLVREDGKIPFASVAWPGLVGVVSGMNAEGLAAVVHGGRAGEPRAEGEPVVHGLRRLLSEARDVGEAVGLSRQRPPLVSHLIVLADAAGRTVAIERVPGAEPHVRELSTAAVVTNHFEGPFASDPKNLRVLEKTSTRARRERGDELVRDLKEPVDPARAVALLRDRKGANGKELKLGDRRAIDALIATHGVVFQTAERMLWVSESPHLLGRFVRFDLERLLSPDYDPEASDSLATLPADPLLESAEYKNLER